MKGEGRRGKEREGEGRGGEGRGEEGRGEVLYIHHGVIVLKTYRAMTLVTLL